MKRHALVVIRHPVGGIRTFIKYVYGRFDPAGYRFTFVMPASGQGDLLRNDLSNFTMDTVAVDRARPEKAIFGGVRRILNGGHPIDLIHSHGFTAGLLTSVASIGHRIPHILTPHDVIRPRQFAGPTGALKKPAYGVLLRRIDVIQCVGEDARANLLAAFPALGRRAGAVVTIRNGIPVGHFSGARTETRRSGGPTTFGFLGRFMPEKGFPILIDAIERLAASGLTPADLLVLAVNDGAYVREYKDAIEKRKLSRYFSFSGFVSDVKSVYARIDAVVSPSVSETCPLLPMEAFVAGVPIIASDCIGLREVAADSPALVFRSGDAAGLADRMKLIIASPDAYKRRARDFRAEAARRFDVRDTADRLEALISRVIRSPSPPSPTT